MTYLFHWFFFLLLWIFAFCFINFHSDFYCLFFCSVCFFGFILQFFSQLPKSESEVIDCFIIGTNWCQFHLRTAFMRPPQILICWVLVFSQFEILYVPLDYVFNHMLCRSMLFAFHVWDYKEVFMFTDISLTSLRL